MRRRTRAALGALAAAIAASTAMVAGNSAALGAASASASSAPTARSACDTPRPGHASCDALVRIGSGGTAIAQPFASATAPSGYAPADLQKAYALTPAIAHSGTVALVDAFDDPHAEHDLGVYRAKFGLPACTTANGCFKKINQNGAAAPLPTAAADWGLEISLDIEMVSAICPHCHIVLVEANDDSFLNLARAAKKAASFSHVVSNSYGGDDGAGAGAFASYYDTPGVQQVASSGDYDFNGNPNAGPQVPAVFKTVTAVGGTALNRAANARGFTETVWSSGGGAGSGSGCSVSIAKPSWQHDKSCTMRMVADVAAVADPSTGVAVYDSFGYNGWLVVGGTSASSPIVASVYALAGNAASIPNNASHVYANATHLFDVTSGSNGVCAGSYECTAKPGYDGPTGLGTPNGIGAF